MALSFTSDQYQNPYGRAGTRVLIGSGQDWDNAWTLLGEGSPDPRYFEQMPDNEASSSLGQWMMKPEVAQNYLGYVQVSSPSEGHRFEDYVGKPGGYKDPSLIRYDPEFGFITPSSNMIPDSGDFLDNIMPVVVGAAFGAPAVGAALGGEAAATTGVGIAGTGAESAGTAFSGSVASGEVTGVGAGTAGEVAGTGAAESGGTLLSPPPSGIPADTGVADEFAPYENSPAGSGSPVPEAVPSGTQPPAPVSEVFPSGTQPPAPVSEVFPSGTQPPAPVTEAGTRAGIIDAVRNSTTPSWLNTLSPTARMIANAALSGGARGAMAANAQRQQIQAQIEAEQRHRQDVIRRGQVTAFGNGAFTPRPGIINGARGG